MKDMYILVKLKEGAELRKIIDLCNLIEADGNVRGLVIMSEDDTTDKGVSE